MLSWIKKLFTKSRKLRKACPGCARMDKTFEVKEGAGVVQLFCSRCCRIFQQ